MYQCYIARTRVPTSLNSSGLRSANNATSWMMLLSKTISKTFSGILDTEIFTGRPGKGST